MNEYYTSLEELAREVWKSPHSDFYRTAWSKKGYVPDSRRAGNGFDFQNIPILTKEDILSESIAGKMYEPVPPMRFAALSSGTASRPCVSVHSQFKLSPVAGYWNRMPQFSYSSYMVLLSPILGGSALPLALSSNPAAFPSGVIYSFGDVNNLNLSAHIAREVSADHIVTTPSLAVLFVESLRDCGYDPVLIKNMRLVGEPITSAVSALLKKLYPNAVIIFSYNSTEIMFSRMGERSSLCSELEKVSLNAFHLNEEDFYFEEDEGDLIVTTLRKILFPLIRYRVGDRVRFVENFHCSCGFPAGKIGIIGARSDGKSYKIGGAIFRAEEVARVLRIAPPNVITGDFCLHIEQVAEGKRILTAPILILKPSNGIPQPETAAFIFDIFLKEFRVGAKTIREAVEGGFMKPIEIRFDPSIRGCEILPPKELLAGF